MKTKDKIRNEVRAAREQLSEEWIATHSARVQERLLGLMEFSACKAVATYLAIEDEVATEAIVNFCRESDRSVFVPAYDADVERYRLCLMKNGEELHAGKWGIPEPVKPDWVGDATRIDCMVVPGLAFDSAGGRVGHGCGFYDRMALEPCVREAWKAGMAFDFQVFDRVPTASHDVPMDVIVTESRVFNRKGE